MPQEILRSDARKIFWGVLGTLGAVTLIVWAVILLLTADPANDPLPDAARPDRARSRQELDAQDQALLHGYAWVDKKNGVVRIPVERAAALWLQEKRR